jgi:hypothetical protein
VLARVRGDGAAVREARAWTEAFLDTVAP